MSRLMKILTICAGLYVVLLPLFIHFKMSKMECRGIEITIADSAEHRFVTRDDIMSFIRSTGVHVKGAQVSKINVTEIEEKIKTMKELKVAEVFFTADNVMHVYVDQREPVMRVVPSSGGMFFIDTEGVIMRRHNIYTPRVHVLEADMAFDAESMNGMNIHDSEKTANLVKAFDLVNYINDDRFWNAMIDHLSMSHDGEIDMVPRIGCHVIHLGVPDNYEEKLDKLLVFYRKVMPEAGWDRYKRIDLEYDGQIVCQRR
jgi:cell division protein FtsQ